MPKRLLVLAPHTDDGEFGCGSTIAKLVEEGWEAHYIAFSGCHESLPAGWPDDTLVKEAAAATRILGVREEHLQVLHFKVRHMPQHRQEILELMVQLRGTLEPDIVLLPSLNDTHQDHQQVAQEGFRAFKTTCMLGYEMPWNNLEFRTTAFSVLDEKHVRKKVQAMKCYKSQAHRAYAQEDLIWSMARMRGAQIAAPYAEAFEVFRWIM